jgi:hypothetical protein
MLYLIKHCVFICLCFWVLKHINTISVLPFFFFPLQVPFYSLIKDEKGLVAVNTVCKHRDLESALLFILATLGLLKLYSFSSLLVIRP